MPKFITTRFAALRRLPGLRGRRGSILIMVVAVLVLLALMGTAFISTARIDRQGAVPLNASTVQEVIDGLLPSLKTMAEDAVLNDVTTVTGGYRPAGDLDYDHWDYAASNWGKDGSAGTGLEFDRLNDYWLASRIPELRGVSGGLNQENQIYLWNSLSRPLNQPVPTATGTSKVAKKFESPFDKGYSDAQKTGLFSFYPRYGQDLDEKSALGAAYPIMFAPSSLAITYPPTHPEASLQKRTRVYPALMMYHPQGASGSMLMDPKDSGDAFKVLAADADGDGIADSGLWPMDLEIDGVRYYAAARIVDEGSAINVNTAWSESGDFSAGAGSAGGWDSAPNWVFPTSVGLLELFPDYTTGSKQSAHMAVINTARFNGDGVPLKPPVEDAVPVSASANARNDFEYTLQGEAHYFGTVSRLENPGFRKSGGQGATPDDRTFKPFRADENMDLKYRFGMMNPGDITPRGSLDALLNGNGGGTGVANDALYQSAPNYTKPTPQASLDSRFRFFPPAEEKFWFYLNYDSTGSRATAVDPKGQSLLGTPTPTQPLRSLLTTSNGVSNSILKHLGPGGDVPHDGMLPYASKGRWELNYASTVGYKRGDVIVHSYFPVAGTAPGLTRPFVCIQDVKGAGEPNTDTTNWAPLIARGQWLATPVMGGAFVKGNIVLFDDPATAGAIEKDLYVCIADGGSGAPNTDANHWAKVTGGATPARVSLNTAPFAELFRGFWNVMAPDVIGDGSVFDANITAAVGAYAEPSGTATFGGPTGGRSFNNPYIGNKFQPYEYIDATAGGAAPFQPVAATAGTEPGTHPAHMFRSSLRGVPNAAGTFTTDTPRLAPDQMVLLRAAIAAVNAEDMRDNDSDVTAREVQLKAWVGGVELPVQVVVYGTEPQPFITEVYVNTDTIRPAPAAATPNPNGYVAIELYNPYPVPINLTNWALARVNRQNGRPTPDLNDGTTNPLYTAITPLANFVAGDPNPATETFPVAGNAALVIEPYGYMILENYNSAALTGEVPPSATGGEATYRPPSSGMIAEGPITLAGAFPSVKTVFVPGLGSGVAPLNLTATNHEVVLMRPRLASGAFSWYVSASENGPATPAPGAQPYPSGMPYDERPTSASRFRDLVPVDSYDFTGLTLPIAADEANAQAWHYVRSNSTGALRAFHFVYPGRYDAGNTSGVAPFRSRQAGTQETLIWLNGNAANDPWDPTIGGMPPGYSASTPPDPAVAVLGPPMTLSQVFNGTMYGPPAGAGGDANQNNDESYPTSFPIQIANGNFAIPAPGTNIASIGHNPVLAGVNKFPFGGFSRTGDVLAVPFIGAYRIFAPTIGASGAILEINSITMDAAMAEDTMTIGDPGIPAGLSAYDVEIEQVGRFCPSWRPEGLRTLVSYDWARDIFDHFTAIQNHHDDFIPNVDPARYPPATPPKGVSNLLGAFPNTADDQGAPMQGLVNVNTASRRVLAALPLVINPTTGEIDSVKTFELADAIVKYRDGDGTNPPRGPFKSLFELNDVVKTGSADGFYNMMGNFTADADDTAGDFTPQNASLVGIQPALEGVRNDYEERYLNLTRLSNLITTRSDSFTCYVMIQGWRGAGTPYPYLVGERRAAFTIDRSQIGSSNSRVNSLSIPTR
ncbi:MAG TPA: hypothetical protein VER17_16495 [Tepidisphaeraceae bacterium]|nr:hypothetical protein [Tepidisphaeraceae bacterium]